MTRGSALAGRHLVARAPSVVWAHLRLARMSDTSSAFLGTIVGAGLAGAFGSAPGTALAIAASNAFLSAASMMINDWHDVDEDRINCPHRPIPSGEVPAGRALRMAVAAFVVGVALAATTGRVFALGALMVTALSVAYTWRLKRVPLAGHVVTAALSCYPLWCWALIGSPSVAFWAVAAGYFVGTVGKEIARTAADVPGDAAVGTRTVATILGAATANYMAFAIVSCGALIAALPVLSGDMDAAYSTVAVAALIGLAPGLVLLARDPSSRVTSRRLIVAARTTTVLMMLALAWDLR